MDAGIKPTHNQNAGSAEGRRGLVEVRFVGGKQGMVGVRKWLPLEQLLLASRQRLSGACWLQYNVCNVCNVCNVYQARRAGVYQVRAGCNITYVTYVTYVTFIRRVAPAFIRCVLAAI